MAAFALVLATNPVLAFVICRNFSGAMGILLLLLSCAVCIGCTVSLFVRTGRVQGSDDIFLGESGALPTEVLAAVILFTPLLGMALGLSLGAVDVVIAGIGTAGGGVMLMTEGELVTQEEEGLEPRTAVGVSEDGKTVWFLVVDGRNWSYSNGMRYQELGLCFQSIGAHDAINLDGGGSTTFLVRTTPEFTDDRFKVCNWPCDNGGQERAVGDGLLIISNQ